MSDPTSEIVQTVRTRNFSDEQLADIQSWDDLGALVQDTGRVTVDVADFGNGFTVLDNKDELIDEAFVILDYRFSGGNHGEFVSAYVITKDKRKLVLNDGGTGIYRQLLAIDRVFRNKYPDAEGQPVIKVSGGLTRSDYNYVDANGTTKPASTYYLSQDSVL